MKNSVSDAEILALVTTAIDNDPSITGTTLHELAREVSPGLARLSRRQFHAKYVIPAKRRRRQTPKVAGVRRLLEAHIEERKRNVAMSIDAVQERAVADGNLEALEALERELDKLTANLRKLRSRTA